jgi:hypothetical protein
MAAPADRYEPLPGLLGLPAYLLRKLSPRGRKAAAAVGALLLAGAVALAIVLVPQIAETKRDNATAERRAQRQAAVRQRERLIAEQRPRHGRLSPSVVGEPIPAVEGAITRDAHARAETGELNNVARRTECRRLGRDGARLLLGCTAVTSEAETTEDVSGVVVGYSYRAAVSPAAGRFAFCKTSGRPAVGFEAHGLREVELPRVCGG